MDRRIILNELFNDELVESGTAAKKFTAVIKSRANIWSFNSNLNI